MRQSINFSQTDLDDFVDKATGLSNWLEEKEPAKVERVAIPPELTTVVSFIMSSGMFVLVDWAIPNGACWGGCAM